MSDRIVNQISQRLSLRSPQEVSLEILSELVKKLDLGKEVDLGEELKKVANVYPTCTDFEREFASVCFALATGVGKTRLMGAFIAYLALTKKSRNFFVLAPGTTIYKKLIDDLGNPGNAKYVFKGIAEFVITPPNIITAENYKNKINESRKQVKAGFFDNEINIHIFNIDKINKDVGKVRAFSEYLGESYFEYLAETEDLVVIMDESHHYLAERGLRTINELKPILGLELTATPIDPKGNKFKNVVYEYSLKQAMEDGFVKEPAVATRSNFDPKQHSDEEIDRIKLDDAIRIHEQTKTNLEIYARNNGREIVKPFVLVVAKDTTHASDIRKYIQSPSFMNGSYSNKVLEVHSKVGSDKTEKDEIIQSLLEVEDRNNPIEIVIHVNMLKEGWDVTNLYTIVPLRSSAAQILTIQTIGRGLRLPYGERVGDKYVDRLTIVAHDRYEAILEESRKPDSLVKQGNIITIEDNPEMLDSQSITSSGGIAFGSIRSLENEILVEQNPDKRKEKSRYLAAQISIKEEVLNLSNENTSVTRVNDQEIKDKIFKKVKASLESNQSELFVNEQLDKIIEDAYDDVTKDIVKSYIEIPRLSVQPSDEKTVTIVDFDLDCTNLNLKPQTREIYIQSLEDENARRDIISASNMEYKEDVLENVLVHQLIDIDFINYDENSKLLYKLSGQAINYLRDKLSKEEDVTNVVYSYKRDISDLIASQIREHLSRSPVRYDHSQTKPFTEIYDNNLTQISGDKIYHYTETITPTSDIPKKIFTGFAKACHERYKFDSKSEKDFVILLEKDSSNFVSRWLRPADRQFNITWGSLGKKYEPDFVVETMDTIYMVEIKKAQDVDSNEVQDKAKAAKIYCEQASVYTKDTGGKQWEYVLIPHDKVTQSASIKSLLE